MDPLTVEDTIPTKEKVNPIKEKAKRYAGLAGLFVGFYLAILYVTAPKMFWHLWSLLPW